MNKYFKVPGKNWSMSGSQILKELGYNRLPEKGFPRTQFQGIWVWADRLTGWKPDRGRRQGHRMMAECPVCGQVVGVGKLHSHSRVHHD